MQSHNKNFSGITNNYTQKKLFFSNKKWEISFENKSQSTFVHTLYSEEMVLKLLYSLSTDIPTSTIFFGFFKDSFTSIPMLKSTYDDVRLCCVPKNVAFQTGKYLFCYILLKNQRLHFTLLNQTKKDT